MRKRGVGCGIALATFFMAGETSAETVVLNAVSGAGTGPIGWDAGGTSVGDDASAPGGTAATYSGKVPNKRLYVPLQDTAMGATDTIFSVQVRVRAKADVDMNGTYDGIRVALRVGGGESRARPIDELDTAYAYYSHIWPNNPVTGLPWTWADVNDVQGGVLTAKKRQLTSATFFVDHIQVVVTYGNGNSPPVASSVAVGGTPEVGRTLDGSYAYGDAEGDPEGVSQFKWYRAESGNPNDTLKATIKNATGKNFVLTALEEGKYVSMEVTPVASQGVLMGIPIESEMVGPVSPRPGAAPLAANVAISGLPASGQTIQGVYAYSDADGDREGLSTFRWLRDGSPINGAEDTLYVLKPADVGALITFEVTPVAMTGLPKTGAPAVSPGFGPITGPTGIKGRRLAWKSRANRVRVDSRGRILKASGERAEGAALRADIPVPGFR